MRHFNFSRLKQLTLATALLTTMSANCFAQDEWEEVFFYDLTSTEEVDAGASFTEAVADIPFYTNNAEYFSFKNSGYLISNATTNESALTYTKSGTLIDGDYFAVKHHLTNGTYRLSINAANWYPESGEEFSFFYTQSDPSSGDIVLVPDPFTPAKNTSAVTYSSLEFEITDAGTGADYYLGVAPQTMPFAPKFSFADIKLEKIKQAQSLYAVSWETPENGTITVMNGDVELTSGTEIEEGTTLTIEATPAEGYVLETLTVNGEAFTSGNTFTVTSATTISATFAQEVSTYAVTWATPENGTLTVKNGDTELTSGTEVEEGTVLTIEATPAEGYRLETLTVNGEELENGNEFTVVAETAISATFVKDSNYSVPTYTSDPGKDFESLDLRYATEFTMTNKTTSASSTWTHDGNRIFYNYLSDFNVEATTGDSIEFRFLANNPDYDSQNSEDLRWTIATMHIDWNQDGTFESSEIIAGLTGAQMGSGNDIQRYYGNREYIFDITKKIQVPFDLEKGKIRIRLNYTNAWIGEDPVSAFADKSKEGIVYDFELNITEVTPAPTLYTVNYEANENADITMYANGSEIENGASVEEGTEISVEVTAHSDYEITAVKANGTALTEENGVYKFIISENTTISVETETTVVEYATISYTIEGNQDAISKVELRSGTEVIENNTEVEEGSSYSLYIYLADFDADMNVTLNGEEISLSFDTMDYSYYYEGTANGDQTFVINISGGSGIDAVNGNNIFYNNQEQTVYAEGSNIAVYDIAGRVVASGKDNISVAELADGIYTAVANGKTLKFKK